MSIRTMKVLNIFVIVLLTLGLLIESSMGVTAFPRIVTQTETETMTKTLVFTEIQPTTIMKAIKETIRKTEIRKMVITETETIIRSKTLTLIKTITSIEFMTIRVIGKSIHPSLSRS